MAVTFSPVDFSNQANFTWVGAETDPSGPTAIYFPNGPVGQVALGGVPFDITSNNAGFQAWNAWTAAGGGNQEETITIPVGIFGVTAVDTLINTYWALPGPNSVASLVFTGSAGATYTLHLFGGSDIRGWNGTGGPINGISTVNVFSEPSGFTGNIGVLDMQSIVLPPEFATQTLTTIQLVDDGASFIQRTILDGVTVESVNPAVPDRAGATVGFTTIADPAHGVLANDIDPIPGDTLHVTAVNGIVSNVGHTVQGAFGTLTLNGDGSYSYAAYAPSSNVQLPASGIGQDTFSYTESIGVGGTATSTLTFVVSAPPPGSHTSVEYVAVPQNGSTTQSNDGHSAVLDGSAGGATINAVPGAGAVLIGGPGDTLAGAMSGHDTFIFSGDFGPNTIKGYVAGVPATVKGSNVGNFDIIQLDKSEFSDLATLQASAHQVESGPVNAPVISTVITNPHNSNDTITLTGISLNSLHFDASHFLLV
jgi:VCBS repeat-containing protein